MVTASLLSCSRDLISAGTSTLQQGSLRQGLGQAAELSRGKREEAEGNSPKNVDSLFFLLVFFFLLQIFTSSVKLLHL